MTDYTTIRVSKAAKESAQEAKRNGETWNDYHDRHFVHTSKLDDMATEIERLSDHVEAVTREYRDLKREFHEIKVMLGSEDFDP